MAAGWIVRLTGSLDDRRRYRLYRARLTRLPDNYRLAATTLERYLVYTGSIVKGDVMVRMLDDVGDLFGQAADDGTPIRDVVGDDPVAFADVFIQNYAAGQWTGRERKRLTDALARTVADEARLSQTSHRH